MNLYLIFSFPHSSKEAKHSVEFRHTTRNSQEFGGAYGANVLCLYAGYSVKLKKKLNTFQMKRVKRRPARRALTASKTTTACLSM